MASPAGLAGDGGDPRRPSVVRIGDKDIPVGPATAYSTGTKLHDPNVTFEEYLYHARVTRADERYEELNPDYSIWGITLKRNRHGGETFASHIAQVMGGEVAVHHSSQPNEANVGVSREKEEANAPDQAAYPPEKVGESSSSDPSRSLSNGISDDEYTQASRALRTAGWSAVFYLITTDILGPFNVPTAVAYMGYGPAVALYTVFGFFAGYSGILLWKMFLSLDSDRYPLSTYGDIAYRIWGPWARYACTTLQFLQLLFNVAILIIQNGLSLEEIVVGSGRKGVCFVILCLVWGIAGAVFGQIRTLRNIGWIGNASIWLNVFTMIMIMVVVVHSPPNYEAGTELNGPLLGFTSSDPHIIQTHAGAPPGTNFSVQVQGLSLAIYAFGGATIFVELMAEMRRPFDFWKGMITAQVFIYGFYLFFGIFVYAFQGQYVINPAYQSISPYVWQTVGNSVQLITSLIAAILYGNVGLKIAYNVIGRDMLKAPDLNTRQGKLLWAGLTPIFWALTFVVGAAIPQITNLASIVAAAATLQFSYTFPPLFFLGFLIKRDGMLPGDGFNPVTGQTIRGDSGMKRWIRGFKKHLKLNSFHVFYVLGALTTCGLGIYAAAEGLIAAYAQGSQSSFSCYSIYNPPPSS